jgi:hypothetical protein
VSGCVVGAGDGSVRDGDMFPVSNFGGLAIKSDKLNHQLSHVDRKLESPRDSVAGSLVTCSTSFSHSAHAGGLSASSSSGSRWPQKLGPHK